MQSSEFFAYSWHIDENETNVTIIRVYGLNAQNENVCVIVPNFTPYIYVELPDHIQWSDGKLEPILERIRKASTDCPPIKMALQYKKRLYYAHLDKDGKRKLFPYLFLAFSHINDVKKISGFLRRPMKNIFGLGELHFKVHENNASPILQLTSLRKIPTAGWISFTGKRVTDETEKITRCKFEYKVRWQNLSEKITEKVARPLMMGWDIEVYSSNPSAMPRAHKPEDKVFQISCVFARQGDAPNLWERYLLTLKKPDEKTEIKIEDAKVLVFDTEDQLFLGYVDLMQKKQPNIIIGYNIFQFDINYMVQRSKILMNIDKFDRQGLDKYGHAKERIIEWDSSAYKNQSFQFLDAEGRIFVDLLPIIKRDHKLSNYQLKTVALEFLKDMTKDPLDHKAIFKCYRIGMTGGLKGSQALSLVGKYCIKDSELVVRLFEKLTCWIALCEMSKVTNVPIFALFTQGQQLKVFSQIYKKCCHENIVVERDGYISKEDEHYIGATVFPPTPGVYDKVIPFDFSSLYPTSIIATNIDYSTLVPEDSKIPDDKCNVLEWEEHVGCEHDPKVVRKKEIIEILKKMNDEMKEIRKQRDLKKNKDRKPEYREKLEEFKERMRPLREEKKKLSESKNKFCGKRKYKFLKEPMGVLPEILTYLLEARSKTKKEMKGVKKKLEEMDPLNPEYIDTKTLLEVLDKRQNAFKISANSGYGAMGVKRGALPFMPGAMCTTYVGRKAIEKASSVIQKDYGGVLIYGDSVSGDTPILIKYENDSIDIKTIDTIGKNWEDYDQFKCDQNLIGKEQSIMNGVFVWTDKGWSKIKRVIRHKTSKKMYRVLTHTGCVDVTEDHSLLTKNREQVKPEDLKVGDELLHSFPSTFEEFDTTIIEGKFEYKTCSKCKIKTPIYEFHSTESTSCKKCNFNSNASTRKIEKTYYSDYEYLHDTKKLTKEEAFVWGFFMADGSGGKYESGKYSWAINNQNLDFLNRAKKYLEICETNFTFKILDTLESSGVYKLVPSGKVRLIAKKYQDLFYDKNKYKIVPYPILNGSYEIKQWFFEGYYCGDGYKNDKEKIMPKYLRMDCKGKIGTQGLYFLLKSLGYNACINTRESKPNIFRLNASVNKLRLPNNKIKKIIVLEYKEDFVYDLETEEGVFQAGIGELIVKNTDSNYVSFPTLKTAQECWDYSVKVASEVTKLYPKPMALAFEEKIYWRFLILTKKRYMCLSCERDGKISNNISKKGVLLNRRDNSEIIRNIYGNVILDIFNKKPIQDILNYIIDELNKICSFSYPWRSYVITKEVGDDGDLVLGAGKDKSGKECYKVGDYKINARYLLSSDAKEREKQLEAKDAGNAKEYYLKCLPAQVQLAHRMKVRGNPVAPGTRLEFVITSEGGQKALQAVKNESADYFARHSDVLRIDFLYYIKQLANPLDQVLEIIFKDSLPGKRDFVLNQYKYRSVVRDRVLRDIEKIFKPKLVFP